MTTTAMSTESDEFPPPPPPPPRVVLASLVGTEGRVRPVPSSHPPEHCARAGDRRSAGDARDPSRRLGRGASSAPGGSVSLVGTEGRVRPVPSSDRPGHAGVRDRRSAGDDARNYASRSSRRGTPPPKSLIGLEWMARPVSSSSSPSSSSFDNDERVRVANHRGPGDDNALTRRFRNNQRSAASITTSSLSEAEQRVRPAPTSDQLRNVRVSDRRGPGDDSALTRRSQQQQQQSASITTASLSEAGAEQRVRPVPSSFVAFDNNERVRVADHRGPGDDNSLTRRNQQQQLLPATTSSLSEAEQRVRPASSSNQFQNFQVSDHRGPGDDNSLTRRSHQQQSVSTTSSLSGDEQRQRPIPSSSQSQPRIIEARGDATRTITDKVQSTAFASSVASLSEDEQRQRPVPSSSQTQYGKAIRKVGDDGSTRDDDAPIVASRSQKHASLHEDENWWNEKTQRPVPIRPSDSSRESEMVLNRGIDITQKMKAVKSSFAHASKDTATMPQLSSGLKSLLKDEKESLASNRKQISQTKLPIAAIIPSSLQSLLRDERPMAGSITEDSDSHPRSRRGGGAEPATTSPLSSLLKDERHARSRSKRSTPTYENEWWNEKPRRPRGYVRHFQPMNTSYVKKPEPPRDYGDVVTALISISDEDDGIDIGNDEGVGERGDAET